ncbi:polysaccharide deacetylase family protein [Paenibacillus sp. URB8-2]|uniref:polysaccharide deacetylase family protein n=1 Tax=Paenibacillus sp. URB8-2 TaxID=2741301 RepID=UPI0015BD8858|nr:polysaccharide deacetylase family sporulation protein PdaB [Paenibacillus sp. URB8-2]
MRVYRLSICLLLSTALAGGSANAASEAGPKSREYYEEHGEIVWEVPTADKLVALTFDDGPDRKLTPEILSLLKQYGAKATFFVVGDKAMRHPEILRTELEEGHEIGNHTFHHPSFQGASSIRILKEISSTQDAVMQATQQKPILFRPPGGWYNEAVVDIIKQNHMQLVLWSWHQDTWDWAKPGVGRIVNRVLNNVRSGDIILMHDYVYNSTQTVEALKIILPELRKRHYAVVTVSELLKHRSDRRAADSNRIPDPLKESYEAAHTSK